MSMRKTILLPQGNFYVLFIWRKVTSARRVTGVVQQLPASPSGPGATKILCELL